MSEAFQECLKKYGVSHRVSSVGFPHANTRAEVGVKTAKRLLRTHITSAGNINTAEITKAMLQHRNTPDRDIGLSPAEMLYGRKLRDFLPNKPCESPIPELHKFHEVWRNNAEWRELALARRGGKQHERLSEHTQDLKPLERGDNVMVQNLLGNNPKRWDKRGVVIEALPHRQYKIKMDGSNRISLRNRKHLRKFKPIVSEPQSLPFGNPTPVSLPRTILPSPEVISEPRSVWHEVRPPSEQDLPQLMYRPSENVYQPLAPTTPQTPAKRPVPVQNNTPVTAVHTPAQMNTPSCGFEQHPHIQDTSGLYTCLYSSEQYQQPVCTKAVREIYSGADLSVPELCDWW